ncbi:Peptidase C1A papain C-terminal [Trinorchestia longiramus]|nr:Peptidase C1A papain C-terminal [Trinorchestia longiramus]
MSLEKCTEYLPEKMTTGDVQVNDSFNTFQANSRLHRANKIFAVAALLTTFALVLYTIGIPTPSLDWDSQITEYITRDKSNTAGIMGPGSERHLYSLSQQFIDQVNAKTIHWKLGRLVSESACEREDPGSNPAADMVDAARNTAWDLESPNIPVNFDAREQWPDCRSVREIRNQGCCGSCWALSAVEVMSDRQCIIAGSEFRYSAQDVVSCSHMWGVGCDGGTSSDAFHMWMSRGVVSGGSFNSSEGCLPYLISECPPDNHGQVDDTPECDPSCRPGYNLTYEEDKHFASEVYRLLSEEDILQEIFERGPMTGRFSVYEDFYSYKEGVYHHVAGSFQGDHIVKVMGFGVENGMPYYLCANSWGYEWGDGGFFKIVRKEIDPYMSTGIPRLNSSNVVA